MQHLIKNDSNIPNLCFLRIWFLIQNLGTIINRNQDLITDLLALPEPNRLTKLGDLDPAVLRDEYCAGPDAPVQDAVLDEFLVAKD
jgi:hypothetical protein